MCLIIHNPLNRPVAKTIIEDAFWQNQDGFGIFYHDTGEIVRTMSQDRAWEIMETLDRGYTCHFRYSTSGKIGKKQCHPFHIDDQYSLMMNGTIERLVSAKSVDTQELCKILAGLDEERILDILRTYSCRFALLNRKSGQAIMVNRDLWTEHEGVHFSKDTVLPKPSPVIQGFSPARWIYGPPKTAAPIRRKSDAWVAPEVRGNDWSRADGGNAYDEAMHDLDHQRDWQDYYNGLEEIAPDPLPEKGLYRIAVYGTLKQGHSNHERLLTESPFLGDGTTTSKYPMVVAGIPFLIARPGKGHHVKVEVYQVNSATRAKLDDLEGHPDWYQRRVIDITMEGGEVVPCWVYMIPEARSQTHMSDTGVYQNEF